MPVPRVCLVMIVRSEAAVIARALASARPLVTSWCIVDTGSTDDTPAIVEREMAGIPGVLHRRPWVDFGTNRTESLALARERGDADFLLILDADDQFRAAPDFAWPSPMTAGAYCMTIANGTIKYPLAVMFRADLPWRYEGVLHAYPTCDVPHDTGLLAGIEWHVNRDGARWSDPDKYRKGAAVFQAQVDAHPNDRRSWFYLAQSWRDAGEPEKAIEAYRHRASMGGWHEEVFYSYYQIGVLSEAAGRPWPEAASAYLLAHQTDPTRPEPLYKLGQHYSAQGARHVAALYLLPALAMPPVPASALFAEWQVPRWLVPIEAAVVLYWQGQYAEALALNDRLLADPELPGHLRETSLANRGWCLRRIEGEA